MPSAFCFQAGSAGGQSMSTTLRDGQSMTQTALMPVACANIRFVVPSGFASKAIGRTSWFLRPYCSWPVNSMLHTTVSVAGSIT